MKMKLAIVTIIIAIAIVLMAGCASFGGSTGNTATPSPTAASGTNTITASPQQGSSPQPQGLTEAQKARAESIAKADPRVADVLNKQGYKVTGVSSGGMSGNAMLAIVTIQGGDMQRPDGSMWTKDQYSVFVDVTNGKVTDIVHVAPKPLPTPPPLT